ncbi:MAG TPA: ATP phosphoribosyltransferase [Synergistaceae bacterium]|nr:ATP phosphoribosyltransferase [Synergistaceae bacterium]HPJ24948.1 ATP phosphoribosyltransferase [Synergistaceae bacterium]HPQ36846.1 ATP phosphoribosyltransferase [Synergistaceae bacterium]
MLTVALPTGRVLEDALEVLDFLHIPTEILKNRGRKLILEDTSYRFILAKPMDVPLYVNRGIADLALAGSDVLLERKSSVVEIGDTRKGQCRLAIAGPREVAKRFESHESSMTGLRIATKYPRVAEEYFRSRGIQVELLHLHGSIELAPRLGLADCIVDIVQTGSTLKANGLVILEEICPVSLRLVASRKSAHLRWELFAPFVEAFRQKG